jgi:hypothetical protein
MQLPALSSHLKNVKTVVNVTIAFGGRSEMTYTPISSWTSRLGEVPRMPEMSTRRTGHHGGTAWSLPFAEQMMLQPQDGSDGSVDTHARLANTSTESAQHSDEPEDAGLTGGTRSLARRVLGLNVVTM